MDLTVEDIKNDIEGFQQRIARAEKDLAWLPAGYLPYPQHKKREQQQRALEADIEHTKLLIEYAYEGIELRKREAEAV